MKEFTFSCIAMGLILLSACADPAVAVPVPTMTSTPIPPSATAETLTPAPTAAPTPLPLTDLDVWLSIEDDPSAPPIGKIKAGTVKQLYIWAKAPQGAAGGFTLRATLQGGMQDQLGPGFHALADGQTVDCAFWMGGFLNTRGKVTLEAYAGDLLIGSFTFSIN